MRQPRQSAGRRPLRADALRNHSRILAAARDLFVERGPDAPLEEMAQRAGVGIGTLYRRFVNREALMRAVVLEALRRTREAAECAGAEDGNAFDALTSYLHSVLDLRISAVIPVLLDRVDMDDAEVLAARADSARALQLLIDAARAEGTLRGDVTFGDIGLLLVRLSRPLPGPIPAEVNDRLAHRHLDLLIGGLRAHGGQPAPAQGPALSLDDLHSFRQGPP